MTQCQHLFQPLKINRHTYRNRIVAAPMLMGLMYQRGDESAAEQYRSIEERARGGAAAVQVGEVSVNGTDAERLSTYTAVDFTRYSGADFEALKKYAELIKKHGSIAQIELFHAGCAKDPLPGHPNPRGPVGYLRKDGVVIDRMDEEMMAKACEDFATAAAFMQAAGFDGVLVHAGHGWLFSQFLSPLTNSRSDKYGGSLENRARFPIEIFKRIRKRVSPGFIIEARINGSDNVPGGMQADDTGRFCAMIEGIVDSVHITAGLYMNPVATNQFSSMFAPHACNAAFSAIVKKYTSMPVGVVGGINSPEIAETIIAGGQADYVVLARQLIADPEFPLKTVSGRAGEIRSCLRCFTCFPGSKQAGYSSPEVKADKRPDMGNCSINPRSNHLVKLESMSKPAGVRKVFIAGGGVAGLQAAITCAERGHRVTLVEKEARLGGILNFTDRDVDKEDLRNFKNLLINETQSRGVEVVLNTEVDASLIKLSQPDEIILAIGSSPVKPNIPGIENAIPALRVYDSNIRIDRRVLVVGGGLVGCEVGLHLAKTGHQVTIIEMLKRLANETYGMYWEALMAEMIRFKVTSRTGLRCLEIRPAGAVVESPSGLTELIPADNLIYALGMRANDCGALEAAAGSLPVHKIGDCLQSANVAKAVADACLAAMRII
jgi:2,4-dienoyl-CoA reductase-like NADH-dependent reductase (Old Yellow Enzyme family)/thioredoxin reductase